MSGISGILNFGPAPADESSVRLMLKAMAHRGPHGSATWAENPVCLGHCLLNTSAAGIAHPLLDPPAHLAIVFDGFIANRGEITPRLRTADSLPNCDSDAALVLRSYKLWDQDCAQHLLGEFAFAIWDGARRRLFCARDAFGMKPFYYHADSTRFLFASEMQPLFAAGIERRPNLLLTAEYLANRFDEREETLYQGVLRLPAAHSMTVGGPGFTRRKYWDIDPCAQVRYRADAEYAEHFRTLFREAVRKTFEGVSAACWLSGGLDSSSVVCTAAALRQEGLFPGPIRTYSALFGEEFGCDEREYIAEVANQPGVQAHYVEYAPHSERVQLERARDFPDTFYDPLSSAFGIGLEQMRDHGITTVVDGVGGDELFFSGGAHYRDQLRTGHLRALLRQARHDAMGRNTTAARLIWRNAIRASVPVSMKRLVRQVFPAVDNGNGLLRRELLNLLQDRFRLTPSIPPFPSESQKVVYANLYYGWNATVAADQDELFTARFSLERRRPFFHRPLVEYMLGVPYFQRVRAPWTKFLLRQAMKGILPEKIRTRPDKAGFSSATALELQANQAGKVEILLRDSRLVHHGVVDREQLHDAFEQYRSRRSTLQGDRIPLVVGLELWYRQLEEPVQF